MRKAMEALTLLWDLKTLVVMSCFAWAFCRNAVMGAEGAAKIIYKREIAAAQDPQQSLRNC